MDSEIHIPTDRVPPEILQKLKEIGLLLKAESVPSAVSSSLTSSSSLSSSGIKKDGDECDDLEGSSSHRHSVVHVLKPETGTQESRKDSDVVSLFDHPPSPSRDSQQAGARPEKAPMKENEVVFSSRSSPLKDVVNQNTPRSFQNSSQIPAQTFSPVCSQSSQQYLSKPFPSHAEVPDHYTAPSPNHHHQSSPFKSLSVQDCEEDRRLVNNRSLCKTPKRYEDSARHPHSSFSLHSQSPSMSESSSSTITATTTSSSSPQSSRSRSPPSQHTCSNDDDVLRGFPAGSATPSVDAGQKSPKVLTPPETPENDAKHVVPEVFTFDDLTCTEERFRQTWERLNKLHDQFTPTKRSPSTPRHPPSTPTTPSYRRQDVLASPSIRHMSPVDQRFMHLMEASAVSPQSKQKGTEVPGSPAPKRLSVEDYSHQRRNSHSPKPKKRLSFDEDGVSSQMMQAARSRTYDPTGVPYPLPSPRPSGSGSENMFTFQPYPMDGQHFGQRTPKKSALTVAEFQKRMTSLSAFQDERDAADDDVDEDERGGPLFSGTRHVYESIEFQRALQNGRYTPGKRKRSEAFDDGSDGIAICTCAVMERNFLQMAECAYKRIRRMDATPADFDRFRNELAQTNEILRESMGLMKHIRDICDHRKRPRW